MIRILSTKAIVDIAGSAPAEFLRCDWLVRVPSGNPEPDSFADTFFDVDCNALVRTLDGSFDHTVCDSGHERHAYGSEAWAADIAALEAQDDDRYFNPRTSLAHIG